MSAALFISVIEFGLLLLYPYISYSFIEDSLAYSAPEYIALCFSSDLDSLAESLEYQLGLSSAASKAFAYLPLLIVLVALICAMISFFLAAAKKSKGAGVVQLIGGGAGIIMNVILSLTLTVGKDAVNMPAKLIITPELMILLVLMTAFGIFNIAKPDGTIGSKAVGTPVMTAAPRNAYPQVSAPAPAPAPAPMRQAMYSAPTAPAAPAAPATPTAPVTPAAPAPAPSSGGTYTCPVCGTTQKSDLAFCTFCGNANPNR